MDFLARLTRTQLKHLEWTRSRGLQQTKKKSRGLVLRCMWSEPGLQTTHELAQSKGNTWTQCIQPFREHLGFIVLWRAHQLDQTPQRANELGLRSPESHAWSSRLFLCARRPGSERRRIDRKRCWRAATLPAKLAVPGAVCGTLDFPARGAVREPP